MAVPTTPSPDWQALGSTANTTYYLAAPDILLVVPDARLADDAASARLNMD